MTAVDKTQVWAYECGVCYATYEPEDRPEDGRCNQCEDAPNLREKQSEFGAGVVVCLVKFTEHLWTDREREIWEMVRFKKDGKRDRLSKHAESMLSFTERHKEFNHCQQPVDKAIEDAVHYWASGAGDHFYDLDEDRAPQPLRDLADLVLRMRNTHMGSGYVYADGDMDRVRGLWRDACIEIDRQLGAVPNWGSN